MPKGITLVLTGNIAQMNGRCSTAITVVLINSNTHTTEVSFRQKSMRRHSSNPARTRGRMRRTIGKALPYALMFHTDNDVVAPHSRQRTFDLYGSRENSSSGGT